MSVLTKKGRAGIVLLAVSTALILSSDAFKDLLEQRQAKKRQARKHGKVKKIIKPAHRDDIEKAEITIDGADDLYKEIRIENTLHDDKGNPVKLKPDADVDVVIEADSDATVSKDDSTKGPDLSPRRPN